MKNKVIKLLSVLFVIFLITKGINLYAQEIEIETTTKENIVVNESNIYLYLKDNAGNITIETDYFKITSNFNVFFLENSPVYSDFLVLDCNNSFIKFVALDFKDEVLKFIVCYEEKNYYSSINFSELNSSLDLNNENAIQNIFNSSVITYEMNLDKYKEIEDSLYTAYTFFEVVLKQEKIELRNNTRSVSSYTLTGNENAIFIGELIVDVIFGKELLTTEGLHHGMQMNDAGIYQYLYIVDTEYDDFLAKYTAKIKIWELSYSSISYSYASTNKLVKVDIKTLYDVLIVGTSSSGNISIANSGSTFVPMNSISFDLGTTNFTYISKYKIGYISEKDDDVPTYLTTADILLGMFVPYYEAVSSIVENVDNFSDYNQQVTFDNTMKEFNIANGNNNLRQVGFDLSDSDVGTGIFSNEYLHNYSFYQNFQISGLPNYDIDVNMQIKIVPLYYQEEICDFYWDMNIRNNYNCNHSHRYGNYETTLHTVYCDTCGFSFYESHNFSYENLGENGHLTSCDDCSYSVTENHALRLTSDTEYCSKCDYFCSLQVRYISNGDGKTHTKKTGSTSRIENCIGFGGGPGEIYCAKCGQKLNTSIGGIIMSNENDELVLYIEETKIDTSFKKKEENS